MTSEPKKMQVRVRVRNRGLSDSTGNGARLVVTADPPAKKRKPNSGSMKPGETRNPNGRPKGAKGTKAMVRKLLTGKTTIRDRGRPRTVTLFQALLLKELQLAVDGDWRARQAMLTLGRWALPEELPESGKVEVSNATKTDQQILDWFAAEVLARAKDGGST